jgi:adenine-specific DNA glycosylase
VVLALAVLHTEGRVLLERRPRGGLLGGMWAFPEREIPDPTDAVGAALELAAARGLSSSSEPVALQPCAHAFTHLHATYLPFALEVESAREGENAVWIECERPTRLALPVAQQRVLASFGRFRVGLARWG